MVVALALTLAAAAPAAAQMATAASTASVFAGINMGIFEGDPGFGFTVGVDKGVGTSGKVSVLGEVALTWYEFFNVTALQGGLGYKIWESGPNSLSVRGVLGVELCCGNGDNEAYFSFEPGAFYRRPINDKIDLHVGYGFRIVRFEGETDTESVFTGAVAFRFGS
jgi:hypothetical protein